MTDAKFKLEDILNKKKAPPQILDLANVKIESEADFKAVIEKIPDYRIKPERPEDTKQQMAVLSRSLKSYKRLRRNPNAAMFESRPEDSAAPASAGRGDHKKERDEQQFEALDAKLHGQQKHDEDQEGKRPATTRRFGATTSFFVPAMPYQFADPCPKSMRDVNISDLSSVDINWKMLTLARPANKTDEEIFSKLVHLDKLRLQTRRREAEQDLARGGKDPFIVVKNPSASKGGVAETSIKVCNECSEEFCSGTCKEFQYDAYQRLTVHAEKEKDPAGAAKGSNVGGAEEKRKRRKKKSVGRKKSRRGGGRVLAGGGGGDEEED